MLYGKAIRVNCFSRVKLFCPDLAYIDTIPGYGDSYIIDVPTYPVAEFKQRFRKSVLISDKDYDVDLTREVVAIRILSMTRKVSRDAVDYFMGLDDELEFWNAIKIYKICGKYYVERIPKTSMYQLFFNLGGNRRTLIQEMSKLRNVPTPVIFSALMTFIVKMKKVHRLRGISWRYRRDLLLVRSNITDVEAKVYRYLKSQRTRSDLLYFILSL